MHSGMRCLGSYALVVKLCYSRHLLNIQIKLTTLLRTLLFISISPLVMSLNVVHMVETGRSLKPKRFCVCVGLPR